MPSLRTAIAIVVTVCWACSYLVALVNPSFHPPPELTTIMLVIVTYLFASDAIKKNGKNSEKSEKNGGNGK